MPEQSQLCEWWTLELSVYSSWRAGLHAFKVKNAEELHKSETTQKNFASERQLKQCKSLSHCASRAGPDISKQGGTGQGCVRTALAVVTMRCWSSGSWEEGKKAESVTATPDFRKTTFDLVMDLLGRIPRHTALVRRGVQESWFKDHPLQYQEWSIPMSRKSSKGGRRPREVVKSSSLDIFKTKMDTALRNLL